MSELVGIALQGAAAHLVFAAVVEKNALYLLSEVRMIIVHFISE